jgi:tetratricopeptide (TPR) repeat protein
VHPFFPSRSGRVRHLAATLGLSLLLALFGVVRSLAQADQQGSVPTASQNRILLVLPFENNTGQPSLEWIREAAANLLTSRLASAGFAPMSRANRLYALDHLGLPQGFHPSRASSLKLAETLDADAIIVGSYTLDGTNLVTEARLVDVPHLRMSDPVTARGDMHGLITVFDSLAWKLTRQLDPGFSVAEKTFLAAGSNMRLDAFEQYIRGITEPDQAERLRHLNLAIKLSPEFGSAWMSLGREDYASQRYEQAAAAFSKVSSNDPDALEAGFYRGLSLMFSGDYARAEIAFTGVARELPLAEVRNNQGVALARLGKDGTPLFRQAVAADPSHADYHFNLAVSLKRHGNDAEALGELGQCLRLHPNDSEAQALQKVWAGAAKKQGSGEQVAVALEPLERIERNFDEVAFHQASLMLEQVNGAKLAALSPVERAQKLSGQAREYLDRGLLLEAERLYQSAAAADNNVAAAHAGLAEVRERTGDAEAARREAHTSLELSPSVDAYLVLSRLDLADGNLDDANIEADEALELSPTNRAAQELRRQIKAKQGQKR